MNSLGMQHELVCSIQDAAEGHHHRVKANQNQRYFEQHGAREMLGPALSEGDSKIILLTGMMDDMHGPNPAAAMRNPVMAIKAQIIEDEAHQKRQRVYRYRVKLERLSQR